MTAVMFEHRDQVYAVTLLPYDPLAVEAIKAVVPSFARRWSPLQREWLIDAVYGQRLAAALRRSNQLPYPAGEASAGGEGKDE